ncbi:MAG: hypothetical protein IJI27_06890, partial [Oscillospiraceae bacterium]|nr:hypothetical protein [Oscillospiraceae bacterium]
DSRCRALRAKGETLEGYVNLLQKQTGAVLADEADRIELFEHSSNKKTSFVLSHCKGSAAIPRISAAVGEKNVIQWRKCEHRRTRRLVSRATAKRSFLRTSARFLWANPFLSRGRKKWVERTHLENGLPHQCAHWFAMT